MVSRPEQESNPNRLIYDTKYSDQQFRLHPKTAYDRNLITLRQSFLQRFGIDADVLDLCCGTGSYLIPILDQVKSAVALDFSPEILTGFKANLGHRSACKLIIVQADACDIPLADGSVDFAFSFSALYTV